MVDGQEAISVGPLLVSDEPTVSIAVSDAIEIREALALLQENGVWTDDFPFLPDHDAALRFNVLRVFADSDMDPKFAIANAEKYIDYILHGLPMPEAEPVSPLKRRLKAV